MLCYVILCYVMLYSKLAGIFNESINTLSLNLSWQRGLVVRVLNLHADVRPGFKFHSDHFLDRSWEISESDPPRFVNSQLV